MTGRAVVRAGRDAWVDPTRPAKNLSSTVQSQVGGDAAYAPGHVAYTGAYTYMFFHNPAPRGAAILTATLRFYTAGAWGTSGTTDVLVQRLAQSVKFAQLNWNNRPRRTGGTITTTAAATAGNFLWEINVQPHLQTISNGAPNFGWWIASPSSVRRHIWAFDAGHHQPTLTVEWSDAPQTPTNLIPSGAQVVGTGSPVLQWDYVDLAGNTDLAAFQVQIDDNASWSGAINWDSGVVLADQPELDLSAVPSPGPAYPGMTDGMTRYWRVRVQDGSGLWSLWSARADGVGALMQYVSKGTLTLLTPSGGQVTDTSPVVAWTFTGRTLGSFRILIVDPDDPAHEYWHSGRLLASRAATGTANRYEWTLPDHTLNHWGRNYRLILDAWDTNDRVSIPRSAAWVRATHDFTLVAGPPAPPTNLTAWSDPDGKPYLHLQWNRANTPDQWRIWRDNVRIATLDGLDPMTATAGRYEWMDRDARQNYYQTWTVQAVENGVGSPHSPAWSGRIMNDHAWIIDWETDRLVAILDPDISFDAPEIAATYEPLGAEKVVRVVQAQRGQEGTVSGRIIGFGNTSGHDYEDNFLWFRQNRAAKSRTCRLMVGNRTWRVLLGDMVLSPLRMYDPESAGGRQSISACSFSFWSVDGPDEPT